VAAFAITLADCRAQPVRLPGSAPDVVLESGPYMSPHEGHPVKGTALQASGRLLCDSPRRCGSRPYIRQLSVSTHVAARRTTPPCPGLCTLRRPCPFPCPTRVTARCSLERNTPGAHAGGRPPAAVFYRDGCFASAIEEDARTCSCAPSL